MNGRSLFPIVQKGKRMTLSITESDGTKRTMQGAIDQIIINMETQELELKVIGLPTMMYTIQGKATITEERTI